MNMQHTHNQKKTEQNDQTKNNQIQSKDRNLSKQIYDQMCQVIPGGVNSPVRSCRAMGQYPMVVDRGVADLIIDVDGNEYIDYCGSWGALIHGHAHPDILSAIRSTMEKGTSFGITTPLEGKIAQKVINLIPTIEKIRFVSSGTEATMSAVRLARGFTKRKKIVKFDGNYHGHADLFLLKAGSGVSGLSESSSAGIPQGVVEDVISLPYNNIEIVRNYLSNNQVAAVILEPVAGNMGVVPAALEWIKMLRQETEKQGALLIFDEVMTGFRLGKRGGQSIYGVTPDLTTFGKIIGGGLPVAAFGGRADVMNTLAPLGPVYQAGTLSGNPLAMAAGLASLELLDQPGFYEEMERKTDLLCDPVEEFIRTNKTRLPNMCVQKAGSMLTIFFGKNSVTCYEDALKLDNELFAKFFRYLFDRGVYIPPSQQEAWFISMAHKDENLKKAAQLVIEFLESII